jgi:hypothetical protein
MSCLPNSGGCEKQATDKLVHYLNEIEGACYEHSECLDRGDRQTKQPECLYIDARNNIRRLVVERKSLMWPKNYAYEHSKFHDLANAITNDLASLDFQDAYVLWIPALTSVNKRELPRIARKVAGDIRSRQASLKRGQVLQINVHIERGVLSFKFGIRPEYERSDSDPQKGLYLLLGEHLAGGATGHSGLP